MQLLSTVFAALAVLPAVVYGASTAGDRTLVVVDEGTNQAEYSTFLDDLRSRGFDLDIVDIKTGEFDLEFDGARNYDHLLIFPTKVKSLGAKLNTQRLLEFFTDGGNILALTSSESSPESLREFLNELDIAVSPRGYQAVDHFNFDKKHSDVKHDLLSLESAEFFANDKVISPKKVLYRGGAAYLGNSNPQVVPILHGASTAYAYDSSDDALTLTTPWASGSQLYLVAGFQGLNNARVAWSGSAELFSNKLFEISDNREVAADVSKWAFQEKGVIKVYDSNHWPFNETEEWSTTSSHALYHINQHVGYSIGVSEWNGEKWVPFITNDLQLEFVMLDPYYRLTFGEPHSNDETAVYVVQFKVPDQHGIFTFKVDYQRPGLSFLSDHKTVTVRHNANDEWPRSWEITNSWVYLSSFLVVVFSWVIFVVFYLFTGKGGAEAAALKEKKNI